MLFQVGNKVVHPSYGAGTIVGIQEASIEDANHVYYVIEAVAKSMQLMVPVRRARDLGLRRVGEARRLRQLLRLPGSWVVPEDQMKNHNIRHKYMQERIKSGRFYELADIVRALSSMSSQRTLGKVDREIFNRGKDLLAGELALAAGLEVRLAMQEVEETLVARLEAEQG